VRDVTGGHQGALGDLKLELGGWDLGSAQRLQHLAGEAAIHEHLWGDVDRDGHAEPERAPVGHLGHRDFDHASGERLDQVCLLGDSYERARCEDPQAGVIPAHERLQGHDLSGTQVQLGLIPDDDPLAFDGGAQLSGQRELAGL
jgi:hypothetical protein